MPHRYLLPLVVGWLLTQTVGESFAGDWPQILGPARNGVAEGERIPNQLPADWKPSWTAKIGSGYAGPAVVGERVIVFHRVGANERIEAFAETKGTSLWKVEFPANYRGGIDADKGPRCVPIVAGDAVLAYGAAGDLYCVALADGKVRWSRELLADYRGDEGYFGAGSTPIVLGNSVLVNVGGKGAGIVSVDLATGKTIWQQTDEAASYAAPAYWSRNGKQEALFITRLNAVRVADKPAEVAKLRPFGARGPTVNGATPLVIGEHLFLTASYGIGAVYAKVAGEELKTVWENDDTLSSQYATPVHQQGFLYGIHGREDAAGAELRCVELATGKVRWAEENFGVANVILADGKLLILKVDGGFVLAAADAKEYRILGKSVVAKETTRALPALANGRFYFRTNGPSGGELKAFPLGER